MKHDTVASIRLEPSAASRHPTRFFAQAKLSADEPGHPFGQWSVAIELWRTAEGDWPLGWLAFVSPDAPVGSLHKGASFDLYVGRKRIGRAEILLGHREAPPTMPVDHDFLGDVRTPAHDMAA